MSKRVLGFKLHVTKIPEGKTISPYLAITRESSVFQGSIQYYIVFSTEERWMGNTQSRLLLMAKPGFTL